MLIIMQNLGNWHIYRQTVTSGRFVYNQNKPILISIYIYFKDMCQLAFIVRRSLSPKMFKFILDKMYKKRCINAG